MKKKIWILEDDSGCQFVHEQTLANNYDLTFFPTISSFQAQLESDVEKPSMIIADLMLDDGNFMTYLNTGKDKSLLEIPFIIVSSIDDIEALRFCFEEGAVDYLTKPFKKNELLVKVEKITSTPRSNSPIIKNSKSVSFDGSTVENLTSKQKQLLSLFVDSPERTVSRNDILENVWGGTAVHPKTVDVHMYNLRRKLHEYGYIIRSEGSGKWSLIHESI